MNDTITTIETELSALDERLRAPRDGECLWHYLNRMLDEFGCRGHRFTERWGNSPWGRGKQVLSWAKRSGGCCCDCEVVMNSLSTPSRARDALLCPAALREVAAQLDGDDEDGLDSYDQDRDER